MSVGDVQECLQMKSDIASTSQDSFRALNRMYNRKKFINGICKSLSNPEHSRKP
jgi:hypothetical protein